MDAKEIIAQYFSSICCKGCNMEFTRQALDFMNDVEPYIVAIVCTHCSRRLGQAVVTMRPNTTIREVKNALRSTEPKINSSLNAKDRKKFSEMPPITANEQLDFHNWLDSLPNGQK